MFNRLLVEHFVQVNKNAWSTFFKEIRAGFYVVKEKLVLLLQKRIPIPLDHSVSPEALNSLLIISKN